MEQIMGVVFECKCKKCGYEFCSFVGVGFTYPIEYCEIVKKMKEGEFGQQGKKFFETFPNGAITCENIVVQCKDCKNLMTVPELALYIPKEGYDPAKMNGNTCWTIGFPAEEYDYIAPNELEENYDFLEYYEHRCTKCRGYTSVVPGFTERRNKDTDRYVDCPECGSMMEIRMTGKWD